MRRRQYLSLEINMGKMERPRGRPPKPPDQKGVQIRHCVLPASRDALSVIADATGKGCGEILDRLIAKEYRRIFPTQASKVR